MRSHSLCVLPLVLLCVSIGGCGTSADLRLSADDADAITAEILQLDQDVIRRGIVDRDSALYAELALDQFRVLAPGGVVEGKRQAIAGLAAWDASDVTFSGQEVVLEGPVALVLGRLDIEGTMRPVGRWGPLKYMSVWVRGAEGWRLLSRSLTPCLPKVVEVGRC